MGERQAERPDSPAGVESLGPTKLHVGLGDKEVEDQGGSLPPRAAPTPYRARVWRTNHLVEPAMAEVRTMVQALAGSKGVRMERGDFEAPGFPHAAHDKFLVRWGAFCAQGKTEGGALARILALMLEGGGYYPLT